MNAGILDAALQTRDDCAHRWEHRLVMDLPTDSGVRPVEVDAHLRLGGTHAARGRVSNVITRQDEGGSIIDAQIEPDFYWKRMVVRDHPRNGERRRAAEAAAQKLMDPVLKNLRSREGGAAHHPVHGGTYVTYIEQRWDLKTVQDLPDATSSLLSSITFTPHTVMAYASVRGEEGSLSVEGTSWLWGDSDAHGQFREMRFAHNDGQIVPLRPHARDELPEWMLPCVESVIERAVRVHQDRNSVLLPVAQ